jgi:hypothetical protein
MPIALETCAQTGKHCFCNKNVSEFIGKHFCFPEANFVSATMFLGVGKLGNIDRKQNDSATMFPSLPRDKIAIAWSPGGSYTCVSI